MVQMVSCKEKTMLTNRKLDHLGIATSNLEKTVNWYMKVLGFKKFAECVADDGTPIAFLRNDGGIKYEVFQLHDLTVEQTDHIDHISFVSNDIEKDYEYCMEQGFEDVTGGIQGISTAWEKGCRYFKIKGPSGEDIEFDQIL